MNKHLSILSLPLSDQIRVRDEIARDHPELVFPWLRTFDVSVLLVTDGALDFGIGDFGLSTFVTALLTDQPDYVRFKITLAHLRSSVTDAQMMMGAPRIVASIKDFRFDNPEHFLDSKYDEVWLFGIESGSGFSTYHSPSYNHRNTNRATYPHDRLNDAELIVLNAHMRRGGGVFATGDHGALGRALCGSVNRVRSMRYWDSHVVAEQDEVGMINERRNDTNRQGYPGTQFSDQSDDIPQIISPKLYGSRLNRYTRARYPHPLLCGLGGVINVMPDHPHEGECVEPQSLTDIFPPDGSEEYPVATDGGARIAPEVIAISHVPSGNTATLANRFQIERSEKDPTIAHSFGSIAAYDGHRAGVGRVVCDSTWHHFVNVNLIGVVEGGRFDDLERNPDGNPNKNNGFMSTPAGKAVLGRIKNYFVNIGVWIAPPSRHRSFHDRLRWEMVYRERVAEAALANPGVAIEKIPLNVLHHIGSSARDVIGRFAGQCRSLEFLLDIFRPELPEFVAMLDPWLPPIPRPDPPPFPWVDPMRLLETALGAAIVSLRHKYPYPVEKFDREVDRQATKAVRDGAMVGLRLAMRNMSSELNVFNEILKASAKRLDVKLD